MPEWAEDDPRCYWEAADEHERVNGRLFREVEFALPRELNEGEQVELAREFASKLTSAGGERLPYTLAVHRGKGENPHAHLMISERANDGVKRRRGAVVPALQRQGAGERGGAQEHGNEAEGLAGEDPRGLGRSCEPGASSGRGARRGLPERVWSSSTGTPWRPVTSARPRG